MKNIENEFFKILNTSEFITFSSILIIKSIQNTEINESIKDVYYTNSSIVLKNILNYFNNFKIFYFSQILSNEKFLKEFFLKSISLATKKKIIKEKIYKMDGKTIKAWSFNTLNHEIYNFSDINISNQKYNIITIDNNTYLIGKFFTKIQKIFQKGIENDEEIVLKDMSIIYNLSEMPLYVDENMLKKINNNIKKTENNVNFKIEINKINNELNGLFEILNNKKESINEKFSINYEKELETEYNNDTNKNNNLYFIYYKFILRLTKELTSKFNKSNDTTFLLNSQLINLNTQKILIYLLYNFNIIWDYFISLNNKNLINLIKEYEKKQIICDEIKFERVNKSKKTHTISESISFSKHCREITCPIQKIKIIIYLLNKQDIKLIIDQKFLFFKKDVITWCNTNSNLINQYNEDAIDYNNSILKNIFNDHINKIIKNPNNITIPFNHILILSKKIEIYHRYNCFTDYKNNLNNLNDHEEYIKTLFKKLSLYKTYQYLLILEENKWYWLNKKIYFMFMFDFRGRWYFLSPISITECKHSRLIFYYGYYDNFEWEESKKNSVKDKIIVHKELENILENDLIKSDFKVLHDNKKTYYESFFWILLNIAKLFIIKNKQNFSQKELIDIGIKNFLNYKHIITEYNDKLLYNTKTLEILNEFEYYIYVTKNLNKKMPLCKDATASFIQNLIKILGYKNEDSLKYANLSDNDNWWDTYEVIFQKWLENERKSQTTYNENDYSIYNRNTFKSIIMTEPYGAKYLPSFNRFKNNVKKEFNKEIEIETNEEVTFKRFFNFLQNDVQTSLFFKNHTEILKKYAINQLKNNNNIIITSHDSIISLNYYLKEDETLDYIYKYEDKTIRITKIFKKLNKSKINKKDSIEALKPNWVQNCDSIVLRDIFKLLKLTRLSIHDSVLIDHINTSNFIIKANQSWKFNTYYETDWKVNKNDSIFSIFVFF